ncbi:acyl-CoA dehydrogenase family protein [Lentzea sp. NPDC004789]
MAGHDLWRELGATGVIAGLYPEPGAAPSPRRLRALVEELDHPLGDVLSLCPQLAVVIPVLATDESVRTVWQDALHGRAVVALAATDAGAAGSDLTAMTTSVRIADDEVVVRGGKRWITAACFADHALVLARHREGTHFTSFTWVLVPTCADGVSVEPARTPFFEGAGLGHFTFDDVRLPRTHVVGRVGFGMAGFARHITTERFLSGAWANALCRKAIGDASARLAGTALWESDAVRQRLAECLVDQLALDALCARTAEGLTPASAMVLKAAAARTLDRVLACCGQLHGADGFAENGPQALRAAAGMFGIAGGPTEMLLGLIADELPVPRDGRVAA